MGGKGRRTGRKGRCLVCAGRHDNLRMAAEDSPGHELLEEDLSLGLAGVGGGLVGALGGRGGRGGDLGVVGLDDGGEGRGGGVEEGEECALPVRGGGRGLRGRVAVGHCGGCGCRVVGRGGHRHCASRVDSPNLFLSPRCSHEAATATRCTSGSLHDAIQGLAQPRERRPRHPVLRGRLCLQLSRPHPHTAPLWLRRLVCTTPPPRHPLTSP